MKLTFSMDVMNVLLQMIYSIFLYYTANSIVAVVAVITFISLHKASDNCNLASFPLIDIEFQECGNIWATMKCVVLY